MIEINIQFEPSSFRRYMRALDRIERVAKVQQRVLPFLCATDYQHLVVANLMSQKFAGDYPEYHPRYAHWKSEIMLRGRDFWNLYGDLVKNITVFEVGGGKYRGWMAGVRAGVYDSGGKSWKGTPEEPEGKPKPIAMYAKVMEFGLALHAGKARALFTPTRQEYAAGGWVRRGAEALGKIKAAWT